MKKYRMIQMAVALCVATAALAQSSMIPQNCAGKTGDALDKCVRDITPPQRAPRIEVVEAAANPAQFVNCTKVLPADQAFCIRRNEAIVECRNKQKHPDFDQCFGGIMQRAPMPKTADCQRAKPELRAQCPARNKVYETCGFDPLRYFVCLSDKIAAVKKK